MPYDTSIENLRVLVTRTLNTDDFAERAGEAGISKERLVARLSLDPEIWSPAESERLQLERLETEYRTKFDAEFKIRRELQQHRMEWLKVLPLAFNPAVTRKTIDKFRLSYGMSVPNTAPEPAAVI